MITQEFRPKRFSEIAGQDLNKRILSAIVRDPSLAPRSLILCGEYGTGKTTAARIFAKALNCEKAGPEPCLVCASCQESIESSPYYAEYDAAVVGNVETIRELRDTFYYHVSGGYKVIVLDECHLASRQAQSALLKVIEEAPHRVFFLFCSTEIDKIIPTIRSRSLELRYELVDLDSMKANLQTIATAKGVDVAEEIVHLIAVRSRGHMRNAHMYLDQYLMIGEEDFQNSVRSAKDQFFYLFLAIAQKNREKVFHYIDSLKTFPLADLKMDFEEAILEVLQELVERSTSAPTKELVQMLGPNTLKLVKHGMSEWLIGSFSSDVTFQAGMLSLYQLMQGVVNQTPSTQTNAVRRAMKK